MKSGGTEGFSVYANSSMSLVEKAPFLHMSIKLTAPRHNRSFGGYAVYSKDENKMKKNLTIDRSLLSYGNKPWVRAVTCYTVLDGILNRAATAQSLQIKISI